MNTTLYLAAVIAPFALLAILVCKTMPVRTALNISVPPALFFAALVMLASWPVFILGLIEELLL